jgi:WXG100 family type VII secretion target
MAGDAEVVSPPDVVPVRGGRGSAQLGMQFDEVDTMLRELSRTNAALDTTLQRLDDRLSALRSAWTGSASDAYEDVRRQWYRSMQHRRQMLERIRRAGTGIVDGHRDASDSVHRIWGAR